MLLLSSTETESLLDPDALRQALASAMADLSAGRVSMPPRIAAYVEERGGFVAAMPAYLPATGIVAAKLVSLYPGNAGTALPTHQAIVAVFDSATGEPVALLDGTSITTARTAAGSALATELLARSDADVLAIVGTGVQARAHATAVVRVRPFREIRIAGRDPARAAALAEELHRVLDVEIIVAVNAAEACAGANVVCLTTGASEPVIRRADLAPGTHVNSVGFESVGREIDSATVAEALVVVESRASVLAPTPAGSYDLRVPIDEGLLDPSDLVELGELVAGTRSGRTSAEQLTLYKSVGVAVQDAAAAALVLAAAREAGLGLEFAL
jgi:ornithine cyclodeaminase